MKTVGIICEYNPFHNGHLYLINQIKNMYKDSKIIVVMSGNFTQRGELSVINKWEKTEIALKYGADLVVELPTIFSTQSADVFSKGSVKILNYLKVDTIIFGSESNNVDKLIQLANTQLFNKDYDNMVKQYMNSGQNYPTALSLALYDICKIKIKEPNDILGLCYIKEVISNKYNIEIKTIKRTNNYNDPKTCGKISSATSLRVLLKRRKNIKKYIPKDTIKYYKNDLFFLDDYFLFIKFKILSEINSLNKYQSIDESINSRIKKSIYECNNLEELIKKIKTKRYTYNRIKRAMLHILIGLTKEQTKNVNINYIRILGFNNLGRSYLNNIKKEINIPIITNFSNSKGLLDLEFKFNSTLCINLPLNKQQKFIEKEYKQKPIIK